MKHKRNILKINILFFHTQKDIFFIFTLKGILFIAHLVILHYNTMCQKPYNLRLSPMPIHDKTLQEKH